MESTSRRRSQRKETTKAQYDERMEHRERRQGMPLTNLSPNHKQHRPDRRHAAGNKTVASKCRLNSNGKSKQRKAGLESPAQQQGISGLTPSD